MKYQQSIQDFKQLIKQIIFVENNKKQFKENFDFYQNINIKLGSSLSYRQILEFHEQQFNSLIASPAVNQQSDQVIEEIFQCTHRDHTNKYIDIICINIFCSAQTRKLCSLCIRDEFHSNDRNFNMSHLKSMREISQIIAKFQNLIKSQSESFQFDLLISKLKTFYMQDQKQQIILQVLDQFIDNLQDLNIRINNMSLKSYLESLSEQNTGLCQYFQQISFQLEALQLEYYNNKTLDNNLNIKQNPFSQSIQQNQGSDQLEKKKQTILFNLINSPSYQLKAQTNPQVNEVIEQEIKNLFSYVDQLYKSKNYESVLEMCSSILMQIKLTDRQERKMMKLRVKSYFKTGQIDLALPLISQLEITKYDFPNIEQMLKIQANRFVQKNLFPEAIKNYNQILENNPNDYLSYLQKAKLLYICQNYEEALEVYDQIIQFKPHKHLEIYALQKKGRNAIYLVSLLEKLNKFDEANIIENIIVQRKFQSPSDRASLELM